MNGRNHDETPLRIGLLRLTDAAPVIVAHELGFFSDEGVDTQLSVEPSWANIADKLTYDFLDAAVIVPPLALAITLGLRGPAQPLIVPWSISLDGNTVTLANDLADEVLEIASRKGISIPHALSAAIKLDRERPVLAVVHTYSTHNLLLRYWLATGGIVVDRDVSFVVVPPALTVDALQTRRIAGFCAGAPWGEIAARVKLGKTVATSGDIWRNGPEKVLAVREGWAQQHPGLLDCALRALFSAARFCDEPDNASYIAAVLSREKYLGVNSHAILSSLPGGSIKRQNQSIFFQYAATFPWRSQAQWFLAQMIRWRLLKSDADIKSIAERVYLPDLYRRALADTGASVPTTDAKAEGAHRSSWMLESFPEPTPMDADFFCDGAIFEPRP